MCMGCNTYDTGIFIQLDVKMYFANIHISHFSYQWKHDIDISRIKRIFCFHLFASKLICDILLDAFKGEQYMRDKYAIISHTKSVFSLRRSQTNANAISIYDANLTHCGHFRFSLMSSWSCFHSPALIQPPSRASCCSDTQKFSSWFWITSLPPTEPLFLWFGVSDTCINTDYLLTLRGVQHGGLPGHWPGRPRREYHKGDTKYSETSVCESKGFTQQVGQW